MEVFKFYYTRPMQWTALGFNPITTLWHYDYPKQCVRYTFVAVYDDANHEIRFGKAKCSEKDNFNKAIGREIAVKNANRKPFYVIKDFTGVRNEFADEVMSVFKHYETKLLKRLYPFLFNRQNAVQC